MKTWKEKWLIERQEALKATKNAKAPGEDGITTELYKYESGKSKKRLLDFINNIYREKVVQD